MVTRSELMAPQRFIAEFSAMMPLLWVLEEFKRNTELFLRKNLANKTLLLDQELAELVFQLML
mgnify:CR=1 FL=1